MAQTDYMQRIRSAQAEAIRNAGSIEEVAAERVVQESRKTLNPEPVQTAQAAPTLSATQQLQQQTQQELDTYRASEEYKNNQGRRNQEALQRALEMTFAVPGSVSDRPMNVVQVQPERDAYEEQLEQQLEAYTNQAAAEADQTTRDADLAELQEWDEADRAALDSYIIGRDQRDAFAMNPMTAGGYLPQLPENARRLIEKYGQARVDELAETLTRQRNEALTEQTAQAARDGVNSGAGAAVRHNVASVPVMALGGLTGLMGYLQELGRATGRYSTMDPNNAGNLLNVYAGNVRGQTAQNIAGDQYDDTGEQIADGGIGRQLLSYGYQGVMSMADSYARMLLGGGAVGGAALAATSTFAQTVSEASTQGATPGQAVTLAVTNAAIEALSEKIPLDELVKTAAAGKQPVLQIVKNAFAQAAIEATTEEISLFGSILAEALILQEKSSYKDKSAEELLWEAAETAIISGISGGLSSAGASVAANMTADSRAAQQDPRGAAPTQQNPENAADAQQETGGLPLDVQTPQQRTEQAMAETAAQWAQEAPKAEPEQRTEVDRQLDQAYEMTMGSGQQAEQTGTPSVINTETNAVSQSMESYPPEKQSMIRSYLQAVDEGIKGFVQRVKNGDTAFRRQRIADVTERATRDIGRILDVDVSGYTHNINTNAVQHIINRHGENGSHDNTMALDDDIARVGWVLENYDHVEPVTENGNQVRSTEFRDNDDSPAPQIRFVKKIDGTYYIVEAVCENKYKKLWVQSAYLQKNGDVTQAPAEGLSANHETNARSALASPSPDYRVPEASGNVNGNFDEGGRQDAVGQKTSAEEEPGIKGTGAAERNFAGTSGYDDLLTDDNVQRSRTNDVRFEEVPKRDAEGRDVSENVSNAIGSNLTADAFTNTIKRLVMEGQVSHNTQTNKETLDKAAKAVAADGGMLESARKLREVADSGRTSAVDEAKALLIYSYYQDTIHTQSNTGEGRVDDLLLDATADIYVTMAKFSTNSGRSQQLFSLFRGMTPDGQLRVIQQEIGRYVSRMKQLGNAPKDYETQIDPALMEDYRKAIEDNKRKDNTETRERVKRTQEAIYLQEAAKMPVTFKAKWDAWRYMCMLGNAKTQARNLLGNAAFVPYKTVKDAVATGLERILVDDKRDRTKALLTASEEDRQLLEWAKNDAGSEAVHNALKYSARLGDDATGSILEENRQIFDTQALEAVRKFVEKIPTETDLWFKNGYYARSLAGFLKARGYSAADIRQGRVKAGALKEGRSYAIQEAMKATFNDCNALSDFFANLRYKGDNPVGKAANVLCEGVLPFRRTPANIVVRFEEYSPLGIINTIVKTVDYLRGGETSAASVIDSMASTLTGSGAMVLGYFLAKGIAGLRLTGSDVSEDEKRQGHQEYALEFYWGDKLYSYKIDWAAPANLPLFVGANLYSLFTGNGQEDAELSKFTSFIYGLGTMFEPMLSLSCLSSLNDLIESGKYAEDGQALYSAAVSAVTSYFTQGIPTLLRQTVQAFQENRQTAFANSSDPLIRDLQRMAAGTGIVPGLKTDAVNAWGETESQGGAFMQILNTFFNPGTLKAVDNSALEQEIVRLNESQPDSVTPPDTLKSISYTDASGERHTGYRLTEEEYHTLATVQGQTAKAILEKIIESKTYAAMTDQLKASVFEYVYDYAREKGRTEALAGYEGMTGWMQGIEGREADAILNKAITSAFGDAFDALENDPETAAADLEQAAALLPEGSARDDFAEAAGGRVEYFITANQAGVNAETFLELYQQFHSIDADPDLNTSGRALEWSHTLEKAVEGGMITAAQRDVLKDSMVYYQMFPAETEKFDQMVESGISADTAMDIGELMAGITPQEGYSGVRDVQKAEQIAGANLSDAEMEAALRAYLPDNQDENLDLMLEMGYGPEDYVTAYSIYANESGAGKKYRIIQKIQEAFGVNRATAAEIYEIYG